MLIKNYFLSLRKTKIKSSATSFMPPTKSENLDQEKKEFGVLITNMASNYDNLNLDTDHSKNDMNNKNWNINNNNKSKILLDDQKIKMNTKLSSNANTNYHTQTHNPNNNNYSLLFNSTIKRRFSETYYKNTEHHKRPRLVKKCGELNIHMGNVPKHKRRLLSDFFNTILDIKWRWHIVIFLLSFLVSWFLFATVWYLIAYTHGDLNRDNINPNLSSSVHSHELSNTKHQSDNSSSDDQHTYTNSLNLNPTSILKDMENIEVLNKSIILIDYVMKRFAYQNKQMHESSNDEFDPFNTTLSDIFKRISNRRSSQNHGSSQKPKKHMPCVHGIHDFTSALLYSVETQHTIGYGLRYITEECSYAIVFLMFQSCFGIFVQGLVAGVVFAKISRPSKRKRTIIFSHNAVVSERDGKLCFMFKIGNVRISQLSDAKLKLLMIKSRRTSEGEFIPFQSYDMKVGYDWSGNDSVFFPWPKIVEHVIDENSPFYEMCKHVLKDNKVENREESCSTTSTSSKLSTPPTYPLIDGPEVKQEDYEIVVILEGNIETTGASCHIRTSYLPQEILFGYRFVPIYPKFTDFEYLFDYSKFDQIEPFNDDLLHLNVAYINRHLNYVCDTRNENKNYQLTFQNTHQNNGEFNYPSNKPKAPVSILSILNSFKAHNNEKNKNDQNENIEKGNLKDSKDTKIRTHKIQQLNDQSSSYQTITSNTNEKYTITSTLSTLMTESKTEINTIKKPLDSHDGSLPNKNGRFTIVPVKESNGCKPNIKITSPDKNDQKQTSLKITIKQPKQVLFNKNLIKKSNTLNHHRTNSLPPIHSASLLEQLEDNSNKKFNNSINKKNDLSFKASFYIN